MRKRLFSFLMALVILLEAVPFTAFATDDFSWKLTGSTLILTGSGPMPDYAGTSQVPWYKQCTQIETVVLDERFTTIGNYAFSDCRYLTSVNLPKGLTRIGDNAFSGCTWLAKNTGGIVLPDGITEIGARAFLNCQFIDHLTLPQELVAIGENAFKGCSTLRRVVFGENLETIGSGAFWSTGVAAADLPESLVTIEDQAFRSTALRNIVIPDGVTFIGDDVFMGCANLLTASIPASVTHIGEGAFSSVGLQSISVAKGNRYYASDAAGVLYDKGMSTLIRYPAGRTANSYTLPSGVEEIADYAFSSSSRLTTVNLPDSLETIGYNAFSNCPLIQHMAFPESVTDIDGTYMYRGTGGFTLKSAVFEGDAPDGIQPAEATSPSFNPDSVTIYYLANASGWSTPTWNGYTTCPILASGSDSLYQNGYYRDLNTYFFRFTDHEGNPLTNVTVTLDGVSVSSGDASTLSFAAIPTADSLLTVSLEGYYTVELPLILFDYINDLALYPLTYTQPFVQAAFIKKSTHSRAVDLLFEGTVFHAGDLDENTTLYLDINWAGWNGDAIYFGQTLDLSNVIAIREGYNAETNYSVYLTPGSPLYIHMLADGGIYSRKLPVNVVQAIEELPLDLGDNFNIPMPEDDNFLNKFNIGIDLFDDLNVSLEVEADGTVKGIVGLEIDSGSATFAEAYDDLHKDLNAAKEYQDSVTNVAGIISRFAKGGPVRVMPPKGCTLMVKGEASVIGCFTGTLELDSNDELYINFTECTAGIAISGVIAQTFQMYTPSGAPFYVGSSLEAKAEFLPTLFNEEGPQLFVKPLQINASAEMKVRGGLGWDSIAAVGIYGQGGLYLETLFPIQENGTDAYVNASFGAEARVFCFSADFEICKTDNLYVIGGPNANMLLMSDFALAQNENWAPQQRDYLYGTVLLTDEDTESSASGTTLHENIYPYTELQYGVLKNGTELMVWTGDDASREEDNNRTSLFYSYKTASASSWTDPEPVEASDDGTGDFHPVLYIDQNTAYLAWQNASRPLTAEDTVSTTAEVMDITVASLDFADYEFQVLGTLGTEGYDGAHSLTLNADGELRLVWAANHSEDIFSPDGSVCTLYSAVLKEEGFEQSVLEDDLGYIDQTCCNGENVWFSMDTDLDGSTITDREIFLFDGALSQLTENDVTEAKPAFTGDINWYRDGAVRTSTGEAPLLENTDIYKYLQSSTGLDCVVYTVTDDARISRLYANFNSGTGWGEPMLIEGGNGSIGSFDAAFLTDGTLQIAVAERDVAEDLTLHPGAKLKIYSIIPTADLAIDGISYQPGSLVRGGTLSVYAQLKNNGSTAVDMLEITVYDGDEAVDSLVIRETLLAGASTPLVFPVALGDTVPENLVVEINGVGFDEANSADNTASLALYHHDISLEDARVWSDSSSAELVVLAANRGLAALENFTVNAKDSAGNLLAQVENVSLAENGSDYLTFRLAAPLAADEVVTFAAVAPVGTTENILANNTTVTKVISSVATPSVTVRFADTSAGTNAIVSLEHAPFGSNAGTLICALYDADGKMLSTRSANYRPDSYDVQFSFPVTASSGDFIRLFAVNSEHIPFDVPVTKAY